MLIKTNFDSILKNKTISKYLFISLMVFALYGLYQYTSLFNNIKYNIVEYYTVHKLNKEAQVVYEKELLNIDKDYQAQLIELEKKYTQKKHNLSVNHKNMLAKIETNIKKDYVNSFFIQWSVITLWEVQNISFIKDLEKELNWDEIIDVDNFEFSILQKLEKSFESNQLDIDKAKEDSGLLNTKEEEKQATEKIEKVKKVNFNVSVKETKGNIQVLSKPDAVLPLGITFPSFFSYSKNGIKINWYYDLHYGVDYRTKPVVYIPLNFFNEKEGKVLVKDLDPVYGQRLIIWTQNERFEYLHLNEIFVEQNDKVKSNQKIAVTGKTWVWTGPHLHFAYFKDGFYVPYDWGVDVDNRYTLSKVWLNKEEINKIIELGKNSSINMELITALYLQADKEDKKIELLDLLKTAVIQTEKDNKFKIKDYISHKLVSTYFQEKTERDYINGIITFVDKLHTVKKEEIMSFLLKEKANLEQYIAFDRTKLGKSYQVNSKNTVSNSNGVFWKLNLRECSDYTDDVFDQYKNIAKGDMSYIKDKEVENMNFLIPKMLKGIDDTDIVNRINTKFDNVYVNKCDILFVELGKWYQEHNLHLDNPNKHGLFQIISIDYKKQFPQDKWYILSDAQYKKQIEDTLNFSYGKLSYLATLKRFKHVDIDKDYLLKFWLWSYHGLVGDDPNKNFYTANNLFHSNLPLRDITAKKGALAVRDGAFTFAVKLYKNK